ncbi:MAG: hypothetical protein HN855_09040 [Anaerolineae bacterium]|nr:hypothetical protein [Anaerolineae bacterium]MBT7073011.1 hypothetical protein [Anaerolineae bacterium]MBT7325291.1 hypothetical protein [Anaerolineae bacterium]
MKKEITLILLIAILLTGCGSAAVEPTAIPTLESTATPLPEPTLTPTPEIPLALLVVPVDMDQETSDLYQTLVYDLAQSAGMRFQVRNTLTAEDLEPSLRVVIALPPDPGIMMLAPAAPQAQFLTVNIPDMVAGGNVSVLANTDRPDIAAFLSGYIGAMITEDYHTGLMVPKDDPVGQVMLAAFRKGQEYYCGLCQPWAGPFNDYPLFVEIPADAPLGEYNAYADYLINNTVETMYVSPQLATPELLTYLSSNGILVVSDLSPQKKTGNWVATIQPDVIHAIEFTWPQLLAGAGGQNIISPLILVDVSSEHLPPGKEQEARDILAQLQAGYILTGVNP